MDVSDEARRSPVRLARAPMRLSALAPVFGRAFVHEPMMRWPLGCDGDLADRFTRCFACFLEAALPLGLVWEAGRSEGAAVWIPPERREAWDSHPWNQTRILALADDGGRRYDAFWDWVGAHEPVEAAWQLDSIAVRPELQEREIGRALIEAGLPGHAETEPTRSCRPAPRPMWPSTVAAAFASTTRRTRRTAGRSSGSCAGTREDTAGCRFGCSQPRRSSLATALPAPRTPGGS